MRGVAIVLFPCAVGCGSGAIALDGGADATSDIMAADVSNEATDGGAPSDAAPAPALESSGPLVLKDAGDASFVGLHITSDAGPCVRITGGRHVTIEGCEIGPCAGNGVQISGGDDITIADSYIHPEHAATGCCDTGDGVFANGTKNLTLQRASVLGSVERTVIPRPRELRRHSRSRACEDDDRRFGRAKESERKPVTEAARGVQTRAAA